MTHMLSDRLADAILLSPIQEGADTLNIVSGHASPTMASWLLTTLRELRHNQALPFISVNLIVGMIPFEGIRESAHEAFKGMHQCSLQDTDQDSFSCGYVIEGPSVRSNLYVWLKGGKPCAAFTGSAPFLQSAFLPSHIEDLMLEVDPRAALDYFLGVEKRSMFCNHAEIDTQICITNDFPSSASSRPGNESDEKVEEVTLSLLTKDGEVGSRSGLNWGQRGTRNPNEAYIPVPASVSRSKFFPDGRRHFTVQTDDHKSLILRLEQQNDKALATPLNNSLLGEYFRRRLGLGNGQFVSKEDLDKYGRHDVRFTKIDEEQYYMDFSRPVE